MNSTPQSVCVSPSVPFAAPSAKVLHDRLPRRAAAIFSGVLIGILASAVLASPTRGDTVSQAREDFVMFDDPPIQLPEKENRFREGTLDLWLAALRSPESDLRQQSQRMLAWAHARGMEGTEAAIEPLIENLVQHDRLVVRLTAAQALLAMEARQAAPALFQRSQQDGPDMAQLVEPVLGSWRYAPLIDVWRRRLPDERVDRRRRLLAIRGLGDAADGEAAESLQPIADDGDQSMDLRLAAATALGQIRREGLETAARQLWTRQSPPALIDRLAAVRLLRFHDSPDARTLLIEMTEDQQSAVVAGALERLLELDPEQIVPLADSLLARGDVNVRRLVARALLACPSAENVGRLAELLADPIPSLRDDCREFLEELAELPELREHVVRHGERLLQDERWTVLEQSIMLLATLGVDSAADRLVELLSHPRPEVYVIAAWGLRRLGVEHTLAPALEIAQQRNDDRAELLLFKRGQPDVDFQLAHLLEFFGQKNYRPAEPFLRTFVPKDLTISRSRSAAIWALGHLFEDQPQADLVQALQERLSDLDLENPEDDRVRRFSAISLGRMKASEALPTLETFSEPLGIFSEVGYACAWSIERLTGKPIPPLPTPVNYHVGMFLEPLEEPERSR
jgi:HEAT repeat protein